MSFDNNDGPMVEGSTKNCKPDYEQQAAYLKKRLEATTGLKEKLMAYYDGGDTYRFRNISSLAELLGGLVIVEKEQSKDYARILSQIEEE